MYLAQRLSQRATDGRLRTMGLSACHASQVQEWLTLSFDSSFPPRTFSALWAQQPTCDRPSHTDHTTCTVPSLRVCNQSPTSSGAGRGITRLKYCHDGDENQRQCAQDVHRSRSPNVGAESPCALALPHERQVWRKMTRFRKSGELGGWSFNPSFNYVFDTHYISERINSEMLCYRADTAARPDRRPPTRCASLQP